jgi:dihydroflavonol-4-reductase
MTTIVTGSGGFVGAALVRELLARGVAVKAGIHKSAVALEGLDVETVALDVEDPDSLRAAFRGVDTVFHSAAIVSILGSMGGLVERVNIAGVRNVVEACCHCGVRRLVHVSSVHAFDPEPEGFTIDENRALAMDPFRHTAYAISKASGLGEAMAGLERGLEVVACAPAGILGPADHGPSPIGKSLLDAYHGKLPALPPGGYNFVDIRDVVSSLIAAAERGRSGETYLLSGHPIDIADIMSLVGEVTGRKVPRLILPGWLVRLAAPFGDLYARTTGGSPAFTREAVRVLRENREFDHGKASRELGHAPRSMRESIEGAFQWYDTHGYLHPPLPKVTEG